MTHWVETNSRNRILDSTTGLPKLEEGFVWRIERYNVEVLNPPKWTAWGIYPFHVGDSVWVGGPADHVFEKENRTRAITSGKGLKQVTRDVEEYRFRVSSTHRSQETSEEVTKENMVEICWDLMDRWAESEKKRRAYEDRKSIYGLYPPNSL